MKHKLPADPYEPFPLTFKSNTVYQVRLTFFLCDILAKKKKKDCRLYMFRMNHLSFL